MLLGNGDGTFQPARNSATGAAPASVAVGDFNGDGKLDLATANGGDQRERAAGQRRRHLPGRRPASASGATGSPASVAVGDFNGDGKLDLGVTVERLPSSTGGRRLRRPRRSFEGTANVLLGNGDGSFSGPNVTELGAATRATALPSLGGCGRPQRRRHSTTSRRSTTTTTAPSSVLLGDSSGYLQGLLRLRRRHHSPRRWPRET